MPTVHKTSKHHTLPEATIFLVEHGSVEGAFSIDGQSALACDAWRYHKEDREHHIGKYERSFWSWLEYKSSRMLDELDMMYNDWQSKGVLYLAVDDPKAANHGPVVMSYLLWRYRSEKAKK